MQRYKFIKYQKIMELEINIIDTLTDTVFGGNQAAVVINEPWLSEDLIQSIAVENNLSETAFLVKEDNITTRFKEKNTVVFSNDRNRFLWSRNVDFCVFRLNRGI